MKNVIICSSNPILTRSLYGILRDDGHTVETIEHPAVAVQMVMNKRYDLVIIDSEPFGLSAEDAAEIIRKVAPSLPVLFVGNENRQAWQSSVGTPVDLEELRRMIHALAA